MTRPDSPASCLDLEPIRPLAPHEFDMIRRLAYQAFGLDLKPGKEELVSSRLGKLVRGGRFGSFQDYYRHIIADRTGEALAAMIDALTTNHTSFLREADHFEYLRAVVVPQFAAAPTFEVWSAACSTGEEIWTIACVLSDAIGPRRFHLAASDISMRALRFAQRAVYPAERCAGVPAAWLSRHFETHDRGANYRVSLGLRELASFRRVNLVEPYSWPRRFPVIFCRNVMIYFDAPTQEKVVRRLAEWLEPGGYLFVGHAESLTRISHTLEYVRPAIYRKPAERRGRWSRS